MGTRRKHEGTRVYTNAASDPCNEAQLTAECDVVFSGMAAVRRAVVGR